MRFSMDLKVMTFNIRHGKGLDGKVNLARIAAELRKSDADVVLLQEVDRYQIRSGFQDQAGKLAQLTGMHVCFAPSINLGLSQYGNAVLSRYPILSHEVVYMRGLAERRSILVAKLDANGHTVTVVNTHLGLTGTEQAAQVQILTETMRKQTEPVILAGDFNMDMSNPHMRQFISEWRKIHLQKQTATLHQGGEIDHIFVGMPLDAGKAWVQPTAASDHNAVVAELRWRQVQVGQDLAQVAN